MPRPYYALNGEELREILPKEVSRELLEEILKLIRDGVIKAMNDSGKFSIAKTFPQVSYKWKLEMEVYPSEPKQFEVVAKGEKKFGNPNLELEPLSVVLEGGREGIGERVSPDQVRTDEKMPLMQPVAKKGGTVDELMDSLK